MSSASLDIVPLSIFMNFQAFIDFNDLKMIYNCEIYMGLGKFEMFSQPRGVCIMAVIVPCGKVFILTFLLNHRVTQLTDIFCSPHPSCHVPLVTWIMALK